MTRDQLLDMLLETGTSGRAGHMSILPDHLRPGLSVVFCGTAVAAKSAARGHYYAGDGNEFWLYLFQAGFTPTLLDPEDDAKVCGFGIGLTDLAKDISANSDRGLRSHYGVDRFIEKVGRFRPRWVAFHGKEAAKAVARHAGSSGQIALGPQAWKIGTSSVFVVPSASGSNRDPSRLEGRADRLAWFVELARLATAIGTPPALTVEGR